SEIIHPIRSAGFHICRFILHSENESRSDEDARQSLLDADFEITFFASLLIKRHQGFHFGVVREWTPECSSRQRRQNLSSTWILFTRVGRVTNKNSTAAWCISGACGVEWSGDDQSRYTAAYGKLRIHTIVGICFIDTAG